MTENLIVLILLGLAAAGSIRLIRRGGGSCSGDCKTCAGCARGVEKPKK